MICCIHGACSGNPGLMGMGGAIYEEGSEKIIDSFSIAEGQGYKNIAELLALSHALKKICELEIPIRSLLIQCDSQLLYCQLSCGSHTEDETVIKLCTEINNSLKRFDCEAKFHWISEKENLLCHALAAKAAGMPFAIVKDNKVFLWQKTETKVIEETDVKLSSINPVTHFNIQKLNNSSVIDISLVFSLMTYGIDKYSRAKTSELLQYIENRFNEYTKVYLISVLEDLTTYYSKNVLRWTARGLNPDLAFIKASLETEIKENL